MENNHSRRQVLDKQAREIVYKVYCYFQREAEEHADFPHVARVQERTATACDVGIRTVQRIIDESKKSLNTRGYVVLKSPKKTHNRPKPISDLDDFNKDVLRRSIFEMYTRGEFPTAEKLVKIMNEKVGFIGSASSMLRILRGLGFRYKMCNNGRKFLMERSDIATMSPLRQAADLSEVSAFAVYNSAKSKKKRNKKDKRDEENSEEITIQDRDSEVEEIVMNDQPSTSGKKKKKSKTYEVIDVETSSDIAIENEGKGKRKGRSKDLEEEVISEGTGKVNGTSSGRKKARKSENVEISLVGTDNEGEEEEEEEEEEEGEYVYSGDNLVEAKKLFSWLITPVNADDFFSSTWETRPLHIRGRNEYYKPLLSTAVIDNMLRTNNVQFTKNLDVTSYVDGKRETHNPDGRALPSMVWDYYKNGCSVRLLNPQTFIPKLALLNTSLQDYFGCFVGANVYLTPPDSQGFAPHYDDFEAFVLQVEGKKRWRLYAPKSGSEALPRFSSGNFSQDEIGNPIMEVVLEPGDLLYFPRGTIHQGNTLPGTHSLHVTLSCYQRNTWGDLLEKGE